MKHVFAEPKLMFICPHCGNPVEVRNGEDFIEGCAVDDHDGNGWFVIENCPDCISPVKVYIYDEER